MKFKRTLQDYKENPTVKNVPVNMATNTGTPIFKAFPTTDIFLSTDDNWSCVMGFGFLSDPSTESTGIHKELFPVDSWKYKNKSNLSNCPVVVS